MHNKIEHGSYIMNDFDLDSYIQEKFGKLANNIW